MSAGFWQESLVEGLVALLRPSGDVWALAHFGSAMRPIQRDRWSDVDALVVVAEGAVERFHPSLDWLHPLGKVYAYDQSSTAFTAVTRVCFRNFRRVDLLFATEPALARIAAGPFWDGIHVLFSRSPVADRVLAQRFTPPTPPLISPEQFDRMVNAFWFKATLAVTKVARDELLIALHLALDLVRDCCVLGMLLRDRAEGTNHHRHGGTGNRIIEQLTSTQHPYTAVGILDSVAASAAAFDALAARWSPGYQERHGPLLSSLNEARCALPSEH